MVALKYLINFGRTLEIPLSNWEITLILTWSEKYVKSSNVDAKIKRQHLQKLVKIFKF